jgi:hypothetical protein
LGPKRSTRKGKREYMRNRKLLMEAARAKNREDSVRDNRWERLPSENNRHEFTSSQPYLERLYRLLPEKKRSVFSRYD